jgi:hypothetical protein
MVRLIEGLLLKKYGTDERAKLMRESFPDVNEEAIARAILSYKGNYQPYPKDIEVKVYQLDIDGVFMKAVRRDKMTRDEHLKRIRERLIGELS